MIFIYFDYATEEMELWGSSNGKSASQWAINQRESLVFDCIDWLHIFVVYLSSTPYRVGFRITSYIDSPLLKFWTDQSLSSQNCYFIENCFIVANIYGLVTRKTDLINEFADYSIPTKSFKTLMLFSTTNENCSLCWNSFRYYLLFLFYWVH